MRAASNFLAELMREAAHVSSFGARDAKLAERVKAKMTSTQIQAAIWLASRWAMESIVQIAGVYDPAGESRNTRPSGSSVSR